MEKNVRAFEDDGRHFIQTSILKIWNDPFPPYVPALTSREAKRKARAEREARAAAAASPETPASSSASPPFNSLASLSLSPSATPSEPAPRPRRLPNHYIMNLPASALTFLDAFNGLFRPLYKLVGEEEVKRAVEEAGGLPVVHCYCFTKEVEEAEKDICAVRPGLSPAVVHPFHTQIVLTLGCRCTQRATEALGHQVHPALPDFALRYVRDVAPKKAMYCLEFRLTEEMVR